MSMLSRESPLIFIRIFLVYWSSQASTQACVAYMPYFEISLKYDDSFYRDLSYNFVSEIEDQLFSPLKSLKYLNMKRNNISTINEDLFEWNTNLELA